MIVRSSPASRSPLILRCPDRSLLLLHVTAVQHHMHNNSTTVATQHAPQSVQTATIAARQRIRHFLRVLDEWKWLSLEQESSVYISKATLRCLGTVLPLIFERLLDFHHHQTRQPSAERTISVTSPSPLAGVGFATATATETNTKQCVCVCVVSHTTIDRLLSRQLSQYPIIDTNA